MCTATTQVSDLFAQQSDLALGYLNYFVKKNVAIYEVTELRAWNDMFILWWCGW
jgi:hypothetical protein